MEKTIKNLVSVIVPTNNRPESLHRALLSIIHQNYTLIEIIVIANGCDEKTTKIVNEVQSGTKIPIVYLAFEQAMGGGKARNIGLDKATGEYIAFLDDDDTWHKDKLNIQIALLQEKKVAIVSACFYRVNLKNEYRASAKFISSHTELQDLYYENMLGSFSYCITKKSYIGTSRINEDLPALQDWDLWFKILKNTGLSAYVSPKYLVCYYVDSYGISDNTQAVKQGQQIFLRYWHNDLDKRSINYHKMRTTCLEIKLANSGKIYRYLKHLPLIIKAVFFSLDRYNFKRYLHYFLLPIPVLDRVKYRKFSRNLGEENNDNFN